MECHICVFVPALLSQVAVHPEYLDDAYEGELLVLFVDLLGVPLIKNGQMEFAARILETKTNGFIYTLL